jgi:DNA-binding phage protein
MEDIMFATAVSKTFMVDVERGKPSCEFDKVMRVVEALGIRLSVALPVAEPDHG